MPLLSLALHGLSFFSTIIAIFILLMALALGHTLSDQDSFFLRAYRGVSVLALLVTASAAVCDGNLLFSGCAVFGIYLLVRDVIFSVRKLCLTLPGIAFTQSQNTENGRPFKTAVIASAVLHLSLFAFAVLPPQAQIIWPFVLLLMVFLFRKSSVLSADVAPSSFL